MRIIGRMLDDWKNRSLQLYLCASLSEASVSLNGKHYCLLFFSKELLQNKGFTFLLWSVCGRVASFYYRIIVTFCVVILYRIQVTKNQYFIAQILCTRLTLLCIGRLESADQTVLCAHCVVRWVSKANMWLWQDWQVKNTFRTATQSLSQHLAYRNIIDLYLKIRAIWNSKVSGC